MIDTDLRLTITLKHILRDAVRQNRIEVISHEERFLGQCQAEIGILGSMI